MSTHLETIRDDEHKLSTVIKTIYHTFFDNVDSEGAVIRADTYAQLLAWVGDVLHDKYYHAYCESYSSTFFNRVADKLGIPFAVSTVYDHESNGLVYKLNRVPIKSTNDPHMLLRIICKEFESMKYIELEYMELFKMAFTIAYEFIYPEFVDHVWYVPYDIDDIRCLMERLQIPYRIYDRGEGRYIFKEVNWPSVLGDDEDE